MGVVFNPFTGNFDFLGAGGGGTNTLSASDFVAASAAFAGTNASGTINSTGISVSVAPPSTLSASQFVAATAAFAGTNALGTINSTGISVSVPASNWVAASAAFAGTNASGTINSTGLSVSVAPPSTLSASQFVAASAAFAGTNASGTIASNGISVSVAPPSTLSASQFVAASAAFAGTNASGTIASGGLSVSVSAPAAIKFTQNMPLGQASPISIGVLTATGSTAASAAANPFGSSVSLQRMYVPGSMSLTEVDLAFGIAFPATNQGAGTMSQSFIAYSFGNSTSLASVLSASRSVAWASGTTTAGTLSSLQQGWSGPAVQPFTFASTNLPAGEYAFGHLFSWAVSSTSWTISVYGNPAESTVTASAVTAVTSATLSAASTFATGSTAVTVFSATPTAASVMSSSGLLAGSVHTATTGSAGTIFTATPTAFNVSGVGSTAAMSTTNVSTFTAGSLVIKATATAASVVSFLQNVGTAAFGPLSSGGLLAGSFYTGSGSNNVLSNSGTVGISAALSLATASLGAVTAAGATTNSSTFATTGVPNFSYNGSVAITTATSVASYLSGPFQAGMFVSGSAPTSIDLKSTAATVTGSIALAQPWFALVGA